MEKKLDPAKSVVLVSGGLDSITLLYYMRKLAFIKDGAPIALSIHYGQRHFREIASAAKICHSIGIEHVVIDATGAMECFMGGSQMDLSVPVPEGHYADDSMSLTVVPNRNMILLSMAIGLAISRGRGTVAYAAHAGDHPIYPDCRPEFVNALQEAANLAWYDGVHLYAPFIRDSKADIVTYGAGMGVPFQDTWSCYQGKDIHCGRCGTCIERIEAFQIAGVEDPTQYQDKEFALDTIRRSADV